MVTARASVMAAFSTRPARTEQIDQVMVVSSRTSGSDYNRSTGCVQVGRFARTVEHRPVQDLFGTVALLEVAAVGGHLRDAHEHVVPRDAHVVNWGGRKGR